MLFFIFLIALNSSNAVISAHILTFPLVNQQIISNFILFSLTKQSHGFSGSGKYDPYQVLSKGRLLPSKRGIHRRHLDGFDTLRYIYNTVPKRKINKASKDARCSTIKLSSNFETVRPIHLRIHSQDSGVNP